jgi:hypothetical protein
MLRFLDALFGLVMPILLNTSLIAALFVLRRRLNTRLSSSAIAIGFVVAGAYWLWRLEWYDVWRHGIPSARYLLTGYVPYLCGLGIVGWLSGRRVQIALNPPINAPSYKQ